MLDVAAIPKPLSRAEYDRMVLQGLFDDARVELLRGALVEVSPQGSRHVAVIRNLTEILVLALAGKGKALVQIQGPLAVSADSEPEPDAAVLERVDYWDEHATSAHLVVEVADSSLRLDRTLKAGLYAECGIPEYWIVNVAERVIEVHTRPENGHYQTSVIKACGDSISPVRFPEVRIAVAEVFGAGAAGAQPADDD